MKLRLICREFEGFTNSFGRQVEAFRALNPDIDVQCDFIPIGDLLARFIEGDEAKAGEVDLMLCVTDWLPEVTARGLLRPLNEFIAAEPPADWPEGWSPSMRGLQTTPDGQVYGLPYHDGPEMFMVRTDLFDNPVEQARYRFEKGKNLRPPTNWEEFVEVAQFFTRPEEGLWGACVAGYPDAHNNVYDFMLQLWSRGGALLDGDEPAFADATGLEALTYLHDLVYVHRVVDPACLDMDSVASGTYYASGKAAMMWNWCGFAAVAEVPSMSQIVGRNRCLPMPCGRSGRSVSLNIYWILGITAGSQNPEAAYRFLRHCASPEMDLVTSLEGGNGTRLSTWRSETVQKMFPHYRIIESVHEDVESPPRLRNFVDFAEILNRMVDDVYRQRVAPGPALERAADATRDLFKEPAWQP